MNAGSRIVVNTVVMYGRIIATMIIALLSSRWILQALGEEDFGIYTLIAGLLSMLMFLNMTMSTASQRFLSYALGKRDLSLSKETFYQCCVLHLLGGLIVFCLLESVGQLMLHTVLSIPLGKIGDAAFVLHCLSLSTFFSVVSVPYNAVLISHENILYVACVNVLDAVLKLLIAFLLLSYMGERLRLYAFCMMCAQILVVVLYYWYCYKHYDETKYSLHKIKDFSLFKSLTSYVGWNMIGSVSSLLRTQGVAVLLNTFFGVAINAAYGIATQVRGQLSFFSTAIVTAARPQIVKSEGAGDRCRVHSLSAMTCKVTFLLLSMLSIPLVIEMPTVLELWLADVPAYTVEFTRLIIVFSLVFQFSIGISIPIESVGDIKYLQIFAGGLHFLVLPVGYVLLKLDMQPYSVITMIIIEEIIAITIKLFISKKVTGLDITAFLRHTVCPAVLTVALTAALCSIMCLIVEASLLRLVILCVMSLLFTPSLSYIFALTKGEKTKIMMIIVKAKNKLIG